MLRIVQYHCIIQILSADAEDQKLSLLHSASRLQIQARGQWGEVIVKP